MANPMKYIRDLEAAGFKRDQAEAQVQVVLDAIEGDLVTKADFGVFQERTDNRFMQNFSRIDSRLKEHEQSIDRRFSAFEQRIDSDLIQLEQRFDNKLIQLEQRVDKKFIELEFRLLTRLSALYVGTISIAVAVLAWLIKT